MYANISRYAGAAGKMLWAGSKAEAGLVPLLKAQPGFLGYAALASEQGDLVAFHLWQDAHSLASVRDKIGTWASTNVPDLGEPTERFNGEGSQHGMASPQSGGPGQSLYCLIRRAENLPLESVHRPVRDEMLAAAEKSPGFRGVYYIRSAENANVGSSVLFCDTRAHASAVHDMTVGIMKKHRSSASVRVMASGLTSVLAMA